MSLTRVFPDGMDRDMSKGFIDFLTRGNIVDLAVLIVEPFRIAG